MEGAPLSPATPERSSRGTYINCPYDQKDEAKSLGAHWDPARKLWFVPNDLALEPFAQWLDGAVPSADATPPSSTTPERDTERDRETERGRESTPAGPPNWSKLTLAELRTLLGCFGLPTGGSKATLVSRLALRTSAGAAAADQDSGASGGGTPEQRTPASTRKCVQASPKDVQKATPRGRRPQIVSFDIETTIPRFKGDPYHLLEFGALVVDGDSLVEDPRLSFDTLVRPGDLAAITKRSIDCNHITQAMVAQAPEFISVAQRIFDVLDGRIWLGHNINVFDVPQLTKQFELAGLPPPQPAGVIDTLPLLREHFGKRAGDMKMASLGRYFGQGEEEHRALADARMTMEVVKHAGAIMFLEEHSVLPAYSDAGTGGVDDSVAEAQSVAEPEPE